jgi:hypothetical protein
VEHKKPTCYRCGEGVGIEKKKKIEDVPVAIDEMSAAYSVRGAM